ncbi:MAG: DnaB-like helicase C-terminal domain-containing protein [Clostridia bacterium]
MLNYNDLPDYLKTGRKSSEACVLGCLYEDPVLLNDYDIDSELFISEEGSFLFTILKTLSNKKINKINDTEIRLNCNADILKQYREYGGFKIIETLRRTVDLKNFESYLDDLQKSNLLINYYADGLNLEQEIQVETKKGIINISWLELFKNMTCEEIIAFRESRENNYIKTSIDNSIKEHTGYIPDSYLDNLLQGGEIGLMFDKVGDTNFMPYLSKEVLGLKRQTLSMLSANVNCGKTTWMSNLILSLATNDNTILCVTNEQRIEDFFTTFIVYILCNVLDYKKINKRKIKSGTLSEEDIEMVKQAKKYYDENLSDKIIIASMLDTNMGGLSKLVRKYKNSHNISAVIYDTFKQEFKGNGEASYKDLIRDSRELHTLCKKYDVVGLCCIQTSQTYDGELFLTLSMLSGAKAINEILHGLYMMRALYPQELDKDSPFYCHPFRRVKNEKTGKWEEEEVTLNPNNHYRVLFITKSRDTLTAVDTQEAIIMSFNTFSGTFQERCMCRPVRKNINQQNNKFGKK